jgi:hypothetical protein
MLYFRFIICLALGLLGLSLVLKTLIDVLFTDWDFFVEARQWVADLSSRKKPTYVLLESESGRAPRISAKPGVGRKKRRVEQFLAPPELIDPRVEIKPPPTLVAQR